MRAKRWWLAAGTAVLVVAAAAVALSLALTRGGDGGSKHPTHDDYTRMWLATRVGEPMDDVLARWPTVPYQHYKDNLKDDCYEWRDNRRYLYNLCFNAGFLRSKD